MKKFLKKAWANIRLRLSLLRIWFIKNIVLFLEVGLLICFICTFTGAITSETPVLGKIIVAIGFDSVAKEINDIIKEKQITNIMTFFTTALSVLITIGIFALKAKSIAQTDIKNDKLKIALLKANLYFNSDGKLVKKVEKITNTDINNDGKIDDKNIDSETGVVKTNFFSGIVNAVKEFGAIATADFSDDEEANTEVYNSTLDSANLKVADEGIKEADEIIKTGAEKAVKSEGIEIINSGIIETSSDSSLSNTEKVKKITVLNKIKNWFIKLLDKYDAYKKAKAEKKLAKKLAAAETKEKASVKVASTASKIVESKKETVVKKEESVAKVPEVKKDAVNSFIESLKNRK